MTALHGFLGLPADWDSIPCTARAEKPDWMPMLAALPGGPGDSALPDLARMMNRSDLCPPRAELLLGYSMGGRIALHMLLAPGAERWGRAIIVSASPGLSNPSERMPRLESDGEWARRFRHDPWEDVVSAWNSQPVFATDGANPLPRREAEFDRDDLWLALLRGSIARQEDLRPQLKVLQTPVLWLAGERDAKYAALALECAALNPNFRCTLIPAAGHRLPWTAPDAFERAIADFAPL